MRGLPSHRPLGPTGSAHRLPAAPRSALTVAEELVLVAALAEHGRGVPVGGEFNGPLPQRD
eukprot:15470959-Alexandrium_andersonii.AAC.1